MRLSISGSRAAIACLAALTCGSVSAQPSTPSPVASAGLALANGVEQVCPWFLSGKDYSPARAAQAAFDAGYRNETAVSIIFPFERDQASSTSLGFQAVIKDAPAANFGIPAFMQLNPMVCQLQVYGYRDEADAYVAGLEAKGWRIVEPRAGQDVATTRYLKTIDGRPTTLVVNRWNRQGAPPANNRWMVINLLPGDDRSRGGLQ